MYRRPVDETLSLVWNASAYAQWCGAQADRMGTDLARLRARGDAEPALLFLYEQAQENYKRLSALTCLAMALSESQRTTEAGPGPEPGVRRGLRVRIAEFLLASARRGSTGRDRS